MADAPGTPSAPEAPTGAGERAAGGVGKAIGGIGSFFAEHQMILLLGGGAVAAILLFRSLSGAQSQGTATPAGYVPATASSSPDTSSTSQSPDVGSLLSEVTSAQSQAMQQISQAANAQTQTTVQAIQQQQAQDQAGYLSQFNAFGNELSTERNSFDQLLGTAVAAQTTQQQQNQETLNQEAQNIQGLFGSESAIEQAASSNIQGLWQAITSQASKVAAIPLPSPQAVSSGYHGAPGEQNDTVPAGAPPSFGNQSPQIQAEFESAFGPNAASQWQTQHNEQVARYGE